MPTTAEPTTTDRPPRMPALFIGHGSPMNAIEDNRWSRAIRALGQTLPRPRAVLAISAHWYLPGIWLTGDEHPKTIHDFGGFPRALAEMRYPAPGNPALARRVAALIGGDRARLTSDWGFDHGAWSVLCHLFPAADVPVVQLSVDSGLEPSAHLAVGRTLAPLRDEGVLIVATGNITHNLRMFVDASRRRDLSTPDWALGFDTVVATALSQRDDAALARVLSSDNGRIAHPTPEHYLPLLYAAGAADPSDAVAFPITGFDGGSLSMRSVRFG